ncbi:arabinosaccharide transport system permease protein [Lachnospiraceae bacterium PF1-21]|uniref:Carbohydrate ABC transporter permease n=1 Tax=Ohessyouella blattaphilus TaxID=2949333 RepID=A0ABT1EIC1_9FIRM|nr:carbohydrate ABC transporter permease [Ohessyouella blattaphilus]MCP1110453.1 carbohydrate ABC transporter permease [Ohessyouella blattaphilus]MCR8563847.1 carbohydrate ABC transporter permease [Ohessyouella blattaphilus]MDL2250388.1 carbohydrate ABC transporter permease [Lachnospiraceae bacterium OttesenSCG-928-J05]
MSRGKKKDRITSIFLVIMFSILAILIIIPVYTIFIASFKPGGDLLQYGLNLGIDWSRMSLDNYKLLFTGQHDYWQWFFNSIILTVITVVLTLLVSAFVGYGFAAYEFKGRNVLFVIVLIILSVPFEVVMLPLYKQMSSWGLMDSYVAVVLPFLAHASTIFFFRQYLLGIPKSLLEAGRIDGATEYGIFLRLVVPIMKPAFAAMAILNGMNAWNNYLWPLLVVRSSDKYTLTLGLNTLINPYGDNYSLLVVGAFFSIVPIFILFVCFQKYFIEGMTAGAVKE